MRPGETHSVPPSLSSLHRSSFLSLHLTLTLSPSLLLSVMRSLYLCFFFHRSLFLSIPSFVFLYFSLSFGLSFFYCVTSSFHSSIFFSLSRSLSLTHTLHHLASISLHLSFSVPPPLSLVSLVLCHSIFFSPSQSLALHRRLFIFLSVLHPHVFLCHSISHSFLAPLIITRNLYLPFLNTPTVHLHVSPGTCKNYPLSASLSFFLSFSIAPLLSHVASSFFSISISSFHVSIHLSFLKHFISFNLFIFLISHPSIPSLHLSFCVPSLTSFHLLFFVFLPRTQTLPVFLIIIHVCHSASIHPSISPSVSSLCDFINLHPSL